MKRDELDLLIKNGFLQAEPDENLTKSELGQLASRGFLEELPNNFFAFQNNLTWEVIYETLLYSERRFLHNFIAIHIEKHNRDNLPNVADLLLFHFEKARNHAKCVCYGAIAGDKASAMFANEDALSFYNRALIALENIKRSNSSDSCLVHEHIGDVNENAGDHVSALQAYQKALDIWRDNPVARRKPKYVLWLLKPSVHEALLARKIAVSLEHNSDYDKALDWLEKAEGLLPSRPGVVAAQIAATRSATLFRMGDFEQAISWGKQALKGAKRAAKQENIAYAHNMIANSYLQLGALDKAVVHLLDAEKICTTIADFPGIATANSNLGDCYYSLGDLQAAVNHYEVALDTDEKMHNHSGIVMGHFNLGNILLDIGELKLAMLHLEEVIQAYKNNNCRRDLAAATYMSMCKGLRLQNALSEAESAIIQTLSILSTDTQSRILGHAKLQLAELMIAQHKFGKAKDLAEAVLDEARASKSVSLELIADRVLGMAFFESGEIEQALSHLSNSLAIAKEIHAEHEQALCAIAYVRAAITSGATTPVTLKELTQAIEILTKIGAKLDLAEAEKLRGELGNSR